MQFANNLVYFEKSTVRQRRNLKANKLDFRTTDLLKSAGIKGKVTIFHEKWF